MSSFRFLLQMCWRRITVLLRILWTRPVNLREDPTATAAWRRLGSTWTAQGSAQCSHSFLFPQLSSPVNYGIIVAHLAERGCSSVGRASIRHDAEAGSIPRCGKGFFSQSQLSVQTLLRSPYNPRVQSHALPSVRTLKIPQNGNHTFVWTNENTARTVRNG